MGSMLGEILIDSFDKSRIIGKLLIAILLSGELVEPRNAIN